MPLAAGTNTRSEGWLKVGRLFATLPPTLFQQVKLIEYDLALRYSSTGQFQDVFSEPDQPPVLSVASWLFDDLEARLGPASGDAKTHLFVASLLLAARVQVVAGLEDPGGLTTDDRIASVQWLSEQAAVEIAHVVGAHSAYWDAYRGIASEDADRLGGWARADGDADLRDEPDVWLASPFSGPMRQVGLAALAAGDRLDLAERVGEMLAHIADGYEVIAELASLQRDLERGRTSYPIAVIARAARLPLRPTPPTEVMLGALIATSSLAGIVESALDRFRVAREMASDLDLGTFTAFLRNVEAHVQERLERWTTGQPGPRVGRPTPAIVQSAPTLEQALQMAKGFLVADPLLRESWEVHREGMLGSPEVASRFPAGLILEILCRHGLNVGPAIDEFLAFAVANGFRYYDHSRSGVDTDTIGVVLRLRPHATANADRDRAVTNVLGCLDRNVREARRIPVWISGCGGSDASEPAVIALGEGCGTVAAHLLLGVLGSAGACPAAVSVGAGELVGRIAAEGSAANVNYPPVYAIGAFLRLLWRLDETTGDVPEGDVNKARRVVVSELERSVSSGARTAQHAALLMSACLDGRRGDLVDSRWVQQVLRRQRFDGSWSAEPFAAAPNRGGSVSWYSSTLLTTALCFDALSRHAKDAAAT